MGWFCPRILLISYVRNSTLVTLSISSANQEVYRQGNNILESIHAAGLPCFRGHKWTLFFQRVPRGFSKNPLWSKEMKNRSCNSAWIWSLNTPLVSGDQNWSIFSNKRIWRPGNLEKPSEIAEDLITTSRISKYLENHENTGNLQCFFQLISEQMSEMCIRQGYWWKLEPLYMNSEKFTFDRSKEIYIHHDLHQLSKHLKGRFEETLLLVTP